MLVVIGVLLIIFNIDHLILIGYISLSSGTERDFKDPKHWRRLTLKTWERFLFFMLESNHFLKNCCPMQSIFQVFGFCDQHLIKTSTSELASLS